MSRLRRPSVVPFLAVIALLVTSPALADTVTLLPVKDNTLYEPVAQDSFEHRSDGAGPTMFAGKVKDADADPGAGTRPALRRAVLAFDIAGSIPPGATIDGAQVLPAGSAVRGEVTAAEASGNVKGRATLAMDFRSVSAHGASYPLGAHFSMIAPATKKSDAKKIGIPAAGGAIVGAIIGGGKGAAIGAAAGGGAGTAAVLMTPGKEVGLVSGAQIAVTTAPPGG